MQVKMRLPGEGEQSILHILHDDYNFQAPQPEAVRSKSNSLHWHYRVRSLPIGGLNFASLIRELANSRISEFDHRQAGPGPLEHVMLVKN